MPDFVPTYAPIDGATLDPDGLNDNLFKITSGSSIYEIANGHIEAANFDPAFEVGSVQVRPGHAGEALSVGQVLPNDYFSDLFLGEARYIAVVGATITFRQRFPVSYALLSASGFCTTWRQFGVNIQVVPGSFGTRAAAPDIHVQAFIQSGTGDFTLLSHAKRELPQTVHWDSASVSPVGEVAMREARLTRHFNLVHPKISGGVSPFDGLGVGWHTFGFAVLVRQNLCGQDTTDATESFDLSRDGDNDARPRSWYSAVHRVRWYVRNASAVRLL